MTPYECYMAKQASILRQEFLSGVAMAPDRAKNLEAVTSRYMGWRAAKEGVPFAPKTRATLSQAGNQKSMGLSVSGYDPHGESVALSTATVSHAPAPHGGMNTQGRTLMQDVDPDFQQRGYGGRTAKVIDQTMAALGSRGLSTRVENDAHVSPYRKAMGYALQPGPGNVYAKAVPTTPAVHRDRMAGEAMTPSLVRQ